MRCAANAARAALLRRRAPALPRSRLAACATSAPPKQPPPASLRFAAPSRRATASLAQLLADASAPGDVLCLHGAVGAGKSFFCRAFVRAVADDALLPVPSPTYLLMQAYEDHAGPCAPQPRPVHHYDLYRLSGPEDMRNLELADSFARGTPRLAVTLVEWAERLGTLLPASRLEVRIADAADSNVASANAAPSAADDEGDEDDGGEDARPRTVMLQPHGARAEAAAAAVAAFVRVPPPGTPLGGLALLP